MRHHDGEWEYRQQAWEEMPALFLRKYGGVLPHSPEDLYSNAPLVMTVKLEEFEFDFRTLTMLRKKTGEQWALRCKQGWERRPVEWHRVSEDVKW